MTVSPAESSSPVTRKETINLVDSTYSTKTNQLVSHHKNQNVGDSVKAYYKVMCSCLNRNTSTGSCLSIWSPAAASGKGQSSCRSWPMRWILSLSMAQPQVLFPECREALRPGSLLFPRETGAVLRAGAETSLSSCTALTCVQISALPLLTLSEFTKSPSLRSKTKHRLIQKPSLGAEVTRRNDRDPHHAVQGDCLHIRSLSTTETGIKLHEAWTLLWQITINTGGMSRWVVVCMPTASSHF